MISDALGESEFEVEENEISLTVTNMIGEWGVFIPDGAAAAVEVRPYILLGPILCETETYY